MGAFYEYILALWTHWVWIMTGGPFVAERIAKQIWPGYDLWAARFLAPATRQRLVAGIAVLGIFVASFLAFDDERKQLVAETQIVDHVSNKKERRYPPIEKIQIDHLTDLLKPLINPQEWAGVAVVDNPSSVKLAEELTNVIRAAGGVSTMTPTVDDDPDEAGLVVYVRNPTHPSLHDRTVIEAFRLSNLPVKVEDLEGYGPVQPNVRFELEVSYPPF